jgi:hypothetical protein
VRKPGLGRHHDVTNRAMRERLITADDERTTAKLDPQSRACDACFRVTRQRTVGLNGPLSSRPPVRETGSRLFYDITPIASYLEEVCPGAR